jgi:antitoxin component YwqK of YwqJK toxin-antitoxin module
MKRMRADKDGRSDGLRKEAFRDGTLSAIGRYSKGKKSGSWKYYDKHGELSRTRDHSTKA